MANKTSARSKVVRTAAKPPNAGKGRAKGVPNKTTAVLKDAILLAAEQSGNDGKGKEGLVGYLKKVATEDVKAFAGLLGRVLPLQLTGPGGGPIEHTHRLPESLASVLDAITGATEASGAQAAVPN